MNKESIKKDNMVKSRIISWLLLIIYDVLVYWITVFSRTEEAYLDLNLEPFWTYKAIADGKVYLISDIVHNILMFVPIGLLTATIINKHIWIKTMSVGFILSLSIELLQLHLKRGLCETDDVIHNSLGCLLGYIMAVGIMKMRNKRYGSPIS